MAIVINYRRIGRHFRAARKQRQLKQKDVAERIGVATKTYSNMERGAQRLSLPRILQICELLKLKPGVVLNDCCDEFLKLDDSVQQENCIDKEQLRLLSSKCSDETARLLNQIAQLIYVAVESKR